MNGSCVKCGRSIEMGGPWSPPFCDDHQPSGPVRSLTPTEQDRLMSDGHA